MMKVVDVLSKYNWLYNLIIAAGLVSLGVNFVTRPGPPVQVYGVQVVTPQVPAGGYAKFIYRMARERTCPATISGFWVDAKGEAVARLNPVPGGYGALGDPVYTPVTLAVPNVPPGRYAYRSTMFSTCESGLFVMTVPDAWVTITER